MSEKITKEMVEQYLELHEKITDKLDEILNVLVKVNPDRYSNVSFGYYNPESDNFSVCDYTSSYGFESESVPTKYLYEDDWLEQEKQKLKEKEEREKRKKLQQQEEYKKRQEQRDKEDFDFDRM
ncbi:hypothetical protein N496_18680 (plasmid) [Clostridium botulinum A2B3 87]|uniref:hypothetical protein n=1 Tax=Clostridium botulinum TaxID=1491 RepID=UPI0004A5A962|nr:hypothetical protein [Clostridium botulinum]KEI84149.1 hypothetical protein N493_19880 [Clostridium botulinum B2 433]KEI94997.1 hypothetical protein N496_18680 [Clostridium botulinum A2B3 87]